MRKMKPLFCNIHQYGNFNIYSLCSPFLGAALSPLGDLKALLQHTVRRHNTLLTDTHTHTQSAAVIVLPLRQRLFLPRCHLLILRLTFQNINHQIIFGIKFYLICSRHASVLRQSLMHNQSMQMADEALQ